MKNYFSLLFLLFFSCNSNANLKIATFNIENFGRKGVQKDIELLRKIILEMDADIVGVQEIVKKNKFKKFIIKKLPDYELILSKCGGRGEQYLGFIYKKERLKLVKFFEDKRVAQMRGNRCDSLRPAAVGIFQDLVTEKKIAALSVHLKAGGGKRNYKRRKKQYKVIGQLISEVKSKYTENIIAMGDFNTTGYLLKDRDYKNFIQLVENINAVNVAQKLNCSSYWSGKDREDGIEEPSLLDHILITKKLAKNSLRSEKSLSHCKKVFCSRVPISDLGVTYKKVSDHCPLFGMID